FCRSDSPPPAPTILPSAAKSFGLGSNVSTCDTPPVLNRKMTRFAFGAKCGCRGARGPPGRRGSPAASNSDRMPGSSSEPPTRERSTARREEVMAVLFQLVDEEVHEGSRARGRQLDRAALGSLLDGGFGQHLVAQADGEPGAPGGDREA